MAAPKSGPPAPGKTIPGPFATPNQSTFGVAPITDGPYLTPVVRHPNGTYTNFFPPKTGPHYPTVVTRPSLPRRVSGSSQVDKSLLQYLIGGSKKAPPKANKPTAEKPSNIPGPTGYTGYTTPAPPVQSPTLPSLPSTAVYQPVAAPPLYRPVGTPNLDPYAGQTAAGAANAQLAPQYAAVDQQSAANQAALKGFTASLLAALQGQPQATANDYTQAENVTSALAGKAAELLQGANPNGADQAILQAINAPASQQQAIADKLGATFNGGAGVLFDTAGANAGSALAAQKAAALGYANALPGINSLAAINAEHNLLYQDAQQKAAIAAQFPTLENQVAAAKANALYNQAQFTASQRSAANTSQANRQNFIAGQHSEVAKNAQANAGFNQNNAYFAANYGLKIAGQAPAPSSTWSRALGYKADQYGNPILVNGKPQLLPGYKLTNGGVVKSGKSSSAGRTLTQSQTQRLYEGVANMQGGFTDKKGKSHPAIDYNSAMAELRKEGYFSNPVWAAEAVKALNSAYGKPVKIDFGNGTSTITVPGNPPITGPGSTT